jgi:hypothetical protein
MSFHVFLRSEVRLRRKGSKVSGETLKDRADYITQT